MPKDAVFSIKLDSKLRDEFLAATEAVNQSAPQVVRDLIREYINDETRDGDYIEYLSKKVQAARSSVEAGDTRSNELVAADFAALRARSSSDE